MEKTKKPFYEKVWFWAIALIVIVVAGVSDGSNTDTSTSGKTSSTSADTSSVSSAASSSSQQEEYKSTSRSENREYLLSQARYFGTKDVESLQKATYAYASTEIDGGMMYMWKSDAGTLVRVDLTDSGKTAVYKYDESKDNGLGEQLYVGKTILQKAPRNTVVYP